MDFIDFNTKETANYLFHYRAGSFAEVNIEAISSKQEYCRQYILQVLNVQPDLRIKYYLFDNAEEVGNAYGDSDSCSGFCRVPDSVYAVFSPSLQCTGFHEDAHLLSYAALGRPEPAFIREGLAMFFDRTWHGFANIAWTKLYLDTGVLDGVDQLHRDEAFFDIPDGLSYPAAGAYTEFLISLYGIETYKLFYAAWNTAGEDPYGVFDKSAETLSADFLKWIQSLNIITGHLAERTEAEYL
ncbi:MAG: hypothetical protein ACLFST_10400 [Spirochaetia bacterium]